MRILDKNNNDCKSPDLSLGFLTEEQIIKADAAPIDNETKYAYTDEDWETIQRYIEYADLPEVRYEDPLAEIKETLNALIAASLDEGEDNDD